MSALREHILEILREVVPSRFGDARFAQLAPGYAPDAPGLPPGFTTCGYLPLYVGHRLGFKDGITRGGVDGVRSIGRAHGAWIDAGGARRPRPGDFYGLSATRGGILTHVGVIVDPSGATWTTADAGQGSRMEQEAAYVPRPYDAGGVTLGGALGPRPLAGWLDVQRYVDPSVQEADSGGPSIALLFAVAFVAWMLLEG